MTLIHAILFASSSGMLGLAIGLVPAIVITVRDTKAFERINALSRITRKPELEAS